VGPTPLIRRVRKGGEIKQVELYLKKFRRKIMVPQTTSTFSTSQDLKLFKKVTILNKASTQIIENSLHMYWKDWL